MVIYRRTGYRRRGAKATPKLKQTINRQVKAVLKKDVELKAYTARPFSASSISTAATIVKISGIVRANDNVSRDGNQVSVTRVDLQGFADVADDSNLVRIIVFQWRDDDISYTPVAADILQNAASFYDMYNFTNRHRFTVLWDRTFNVDSTDPAKPFKRSIYGKKLAKVLEYSGATDSSITGKHQIYVLAVSDSGAIAHPTLDMMTRVYFKDM